MKTEIKKACKELVIGFIPNALFIVLSFYVAKYVVSLGITFKELSDLLTALLTLSSVIFAIVGLWIGSIYPSAISAILNDDISYISSTKDAERIERLVFIVIISACILIGVLAIHVLKLVLINSPIYIDNKEFWKIGAVTFTFYLCIHQSKCFMRLLLSNFKFVSNLHSKLNKAKLEHDK